MKTVSPAVIGPRSTFSCDLVQFIRTPQMNRIRLQSKADQPKDFVIVDMSLP